MDSSTPRLSSSHASSLTTIAGKPAPASDRVRVQTGESKKNGDCWYSRRERPVFVTPVESPTA
jgi:hypothetical protein